MEVRVKRTDKLFHSDTFLGEEFSDELYHWKYIKREKRPNGKWRYYYDKKQLKQDAKDFWNKDVTGKDYLREARDEDRRAKLYEQWYNTSKETENDPRLDPENVRQVQNYLWCEMSLAEIGKETAKSDYVWKSLAGKGELAVRSIRKKLDKKYDENYLDWVDRVTGVK